LANEPYIKRLEREKYELVKVVRLCVVWRHAVAGFHTARYKGDARKELDRLSELLETELKVIEPLLAEAEEKDERRKG
jgi:phosphoribosylaminoimidazole-succinocarboxamide synthase